MMAKPSWKPDEPVIPWAAGAYTDSDIDTLIAARRRKPVLAYEPLESSPKYRLPHFRKYVHGIATKGYPIRPSYLFDLKKPLPWAHADRTVSYNLQCFEPLAPLLMDHARNGSQASFALSCAFLDDWLDQARAPSQAELTGAWGEQDQDFLWYDMAVGLRSYRLSYMIDAMMRETAPDTGKLARLMTILDWHRQILAREEAFSSHNNHGLYQALGQMAMSRRFRDIPAFEDSYKQGEARLDVMLASQFFDDGVHREHSPGYHWMLLGTLTEAMNAGLITREDHLQLIGRIEETMSWFIQPNLMMPAFGDTDAGGVASGYYTPKDFRHPDLRHALSGGKEGRLPAQELRLFHDAGYAILRGPNPKTGKIESYMAQAAGFHSKTHKHADDLNFVWHDKGEDILVDAGRYGYKGKTAKDSALWQQGFWYADPARIYAEKTCAHNTVEIDGRDYARRGVKPYGSALRRTASGPNHLYAVESECRHFKSIRHARVIFTCPRRFLIVFDWLKDNNDEPHDFRQWFHLGPNLDLTGKRDDLTIMRNGKPFAAMLPLIPETGAEKMIRGQSGPDMQGWVAHEKGGVLLPNWAIAMTAAHRPQAMFATLFTLAPHVALWQAPQIAPSGQSGKLFWQDRTGYHSVAFTRRPEEDFTVDYRRVAGADNGT